MLIAAYSLFLLIAPCFIITVVAFLVPVNYQKQTKEVSYAPIFAFLSLLLGFTFSQFSLWYKQLSEVIGSSSVTFFNQGFIRDQGAIIIAIIFWLYGLYLTAQPNQHLLRQTMLFLLSSALFMINLHTHVLIGHWADLGREGADDVAGTIGDIGGIATGFTSFFLTVYFGYRLARSFQRELISRRAAQEPQSQ